MRNEVENKDKRIYELGMLAAGVISGQVMSRVEAKEGRSRIGQAPVLTLKAINCGVIENKEILEVPIMEEIKWEKKTHKDDIIMKMNRPYDSVFIEEGDEDYAIPSFSCKISKIRTDIVDPYYLVGFLNSDFVKDYLLASNGASAALLKIADIKKLPVPLPELEEQRAIGEIFKACCEKRVILRDMMEQEMLLAENIILDAAREVMSNDK